MNYKFVSADCDYDSGYTDGYHEGYKDGSNYIEYGCDGCAFEDVEELNYIEMKWDEACPPNNEYGEPMCDVDCIECQIRRCKKIVKRGGIDDTDN